MKKTFACKPEQLGFELLEEIANLDDCVDSESDDALLLTQVKWIDSHPCYDIRYWQDGLCHSRRGITLTEWQMENLVQAYLEYKKDK